MTHPVARALGIAAFALTTVAFAPSSVRAQSRPAAPPAPRRDSVALIAPVRTPSPATVRPSSVAARLRPPTPAEPLLTKAKPTPATVDSLRLAPSVSAAPAAAPTPLVRDVPPPAPARAVPAAATRSVSVAAPANATGRCKDGTYLTGAATEAACASHEGLAVAFTARVAAPARQ